MKELLTMVKELSFVRTGGSEEEKRQWDFQPVIRVTHAGLRVGHDAPTALGPQQAQYHAVVEGYLTDAGKPEGQLHKLVIPNREVKRIYENRILSWLLVKHIPWTIYIRIPKMISVIPFLYLIKGIFNTIVRQHIPDFLICE